MSTLKIGICGWGNVATGLYKIAKKNIKSIASQDNQKNLLDINKNIEQLNDNFNFLSKEISELKKISYINPYEDENKNSNIIT